MALLDLAGYKALMGVTDAAQDAQIEALLPIASEHVLELTQRDFGAEPVIEMRAYRYTGAGYIEIDDAIEIIDVAYPNEAPLTEYAYTAHTQNDVFTWIELEPGRGISPEMGFEYGLDRYPGYALRPTMVEVTAEYGWPIETAPSDRVPGPVKLAVAMTVQALKPGAEEADVSAEGIGSLSYAYAVPTPSSALEAVPAQAQELLERYAREVGI